MCSCGAPHERCSCLRTARGEVEPRKNQRKQCPQKPRNREKPQRGGRALLRPKTDRNPDQKPNQTKPTDRPNPVQDPGREPTPNCTTKFSRVTCSRRAQGSTMSTLVARAIRDPERAVGGSRWIPDRKIDHFMGLFFPVPSRVVCARVC